jgi:hypothetical protein
MRDSWITTGFSSEDITSLQNDSMLPCIFSVACFNGDFEDGTCFAETWMRSTRNGHPIGALATYMSSIDQLWAPPMDAQDEEVDLLVGNSTRAFGSLCYDGACRMMDDYGEDGAETFLTWILFGDPSVAIRAGAPSPLTVMHDGYLCPDQADYTVLVPGVPGARCALYAEGILYGSAITDSTGAAVIPLTPHGDRVTMTLTVTAADRTPWVEQITLPPILMTPVEAARCAPRSGTLDWSDVAGASGYRVQLGTIRGNGLLMDEDVPANSSCPYDSLPPGTDLYWRIAAEYPCGASGPYSDWATFETEQAPPPASALLYPPNGATDLPETGSLDWADAPDSVRYEIVIRCPSGRVVLADSTIASEYPYDLPNGMYKWNVRGMTPCGRPGDWGEESTFSIGAEGSCGSAPPLEAPPDSSTCQETSGVLRWQEIPGAAGYVVMIRADSCGVSEEYTVSSPEYAYSDLAHGRTYHWRVKESCPCSEFSRCFFFTTVGAVAARAPTLVSPPDGANDQPPSGTLDWDDVGPGVTGYRVQIGEECGEGAEYDVADSSMLGYTDLQERTAYYWRVRARFDCDQWGPYSDCFSFQTGHPSSVGGGSEASIPTALTLERPVPNPVVGSSTIRFGLPSAGSVRISLYDVSGREIAVIAQGEHAAGWHSIVWNRRGRTGNPLASGIYLARLVGPGGARVQRMILIP